MAESYIATLKADFDPERYHSDYREALERLVEAKAAGLPMPEEPEEDEGDNAQVLDLVAALRASVDAAKKRRAGASGETKSSDSESTPDEGDDKAEKKPARKTSTKKAAAKKTEKKAAKKSA